MDQDIFQRLQAYVGREYIPELYDCMHLHSDVQSDLFGRQIALPAKHPGGRAGQRTLILSMRENLATRIMVPFPGCAVLLSEPTPDGELLHIGAVALRLGEPWVLHNSAKLGSAHLQTLAELQSYGMRFEGYFAWK